jgi:hypothetical protein
MFVPSSHVHPKPPTPCPSQHLTRHGLTVKMKDGADHLMASHKEQSQRIAAIVDGCSELKSLAEGKKQPTLHLLYLHAVALTAGELSPIAI